MNGIVVGVDRSPAGTAALEWALAEGQRRGRPVTVVHAWTDPMTMGYPLGAILLDSAQRLEAEARREVEELVKEAGADAVDVTVSVPRSPAALVLQEASRTADLVVVGMSGHGAVSRAVLGSVTATLLHHAHGPVAVVPQPRPAGERVARVVVGVDHSPASVRALAWAAEHAAARDAVLVPVLVREPSWRDDGRMSTSLAQLEESERQALRDAVPAGAGVRVEPQVATGHVAEELMRLVEPQDVIVVGSRGRGGFAGLVLGSTSATVAQHAPCPVVVLR